MKKTITYLIICFLLGSVIGYLVIQTYTRKQILDISWTEKWNLESLQSTKSSKWYNRNSNGKRLTKNWWNKFNNKTTIKPIEKSKRLIVCWHWWSATHNWADQGASYGNITERQLILNIAQKINYNKLWCNNALRLQDKIKIIKEQYNNKLIIELHYDKRTHRQWVFKWIKILYKNNKRLADELCSRLNKVRPWVCKIQYRSNLYLLNKIQNSIIVEIGDPNIQNNDNIFLYLFNKTKLCQI